MGLLRRESGPPHGLTFGLGVGDDLVLQGLQTGPVALAAQGHDGVMVEPFQLVEHLLLLLHGHLALHLLEFGRFVGFSPHDVKLAAAALPLRVDFVAKAGRAQRTTLVEALGISKLGRKRVVGAARSEPFALGSALAVGVATLNHEVLDDPMEKRSIEIALPGQLNEVVTVGGRLVVKADEDVAFGSADFDVCRHKKVFNRVVARRELLSYEMKVGLSPHGSCPFMKWELSFYRAEYFLIFIRSGRRDVVMLRKFRKIIGL